MIFILQYASALEVLHRELSFERFVEFHRNADYDEHTGSRERVDERTAVIEYSRENEAGYQRQDRKEDRAEQRDTFVDCVQEFRGFSAGGNSAQNAVVFLDTLRDVVRVELYLRVEEREEQNEQCHQSRVCPSTYSQVSRPPQIETALGPEACDKLREHKEGTRTDDRHNATGVDSDGDYAVIDSVSLVSSLFIAVDNFDSSFGQVDKDDKSENDYYDY